MSNTARIDAQKFLLSVQKQGEACLDTNICNPQSMYLQPSSANIHAKSRLTSSNVDQTGRKEGR